MDRKNNHTANKNKQSKYGKLYFIEHSSEYLSTWIFYLNSQTNLYILSHFKLRNMKLHVLMIKLTHWAWVACDETVVVSLFLRPSVMTQSCDESLDSIMHFYL